MAAMNSDEIVEALQAYGTVVVFQSERNRTFSAKAALFMHGVRAEVYSGFRHKTMGAALTALYDKVMDIVVQPRENLLEGTGPQEDE